MANETTEAEPRPLHPQFATSSSNWGVTDLSTLDADMAAEAIDELGNRILEDAIRERVTDIHFDPCKEKFFLRFRVDGRLHDVKVLEKEVGTRLLGHFKALASIDPIPLKEPADGRATLTMDEHELDLRVACVPTVVGEKLSIRLLDPEQLTRRLSNLGMRDLQLQAVNGWLKEAPGMLLVVGATGSGKTTTLYALLHELKLLSSNIVTIEDPVEYQIDGINQMQATGAASVSFSEGLRAMLRLDPDFILLGEIRDDASAEAAIGAATSGTTLLSTLHSRDTAGAITSLRTLQLPDHEIAAALELVIAQRLVRTLCPKCRHQEAPEDWEQKWLESHGITVPEKVWKPGGCEECRQTGYSGRSGIFEVWRLDSELKQLILEHADERTLRKTLHERAIGPLIREGVERAIEGVTSIEELTRGPKRNI